jgi:hypothetical protein
MTLFYKANKILTIMRKQNVDKVLAFVKEELRKPAFAVLVMGIVSALLIFLLRDFGIADFIIITILAFLASDVLSIAFVRGGKGILQITPFGTQTQPKGYGFMAFFLSILIVAVIINYGTMITVQILYVYFSNFIDDLGIGLGLAFLVYLDMRAKFYVRSKTK